MDDFTKRPEADIQPRQPAQPVARPVAAPARTETDAAPAETVVEAKPADKPMPPRARAPLAAIFVALLVSAGLIALAIYAYNNQQKSDTDPEPTTAQTETVDDQTVQDTSDSIDETLNDLDDSTDFNEADTSDETLGL
jgi:hypothetical protein